MGEVCGRKEWVGATIGQRPSSTQFDDDPVVVLAHIVFAFAEVAINVRFPGVAHPVVDDVVGDALSACEVRPSRSRPPARVV